jgi:hypothetical protein
VAGGVFYCDHDSDFKRFSYRAFASFWFDCRQQCSILVSSASSAVKKFCSGSPIFLRVLCGSRFFRFLIRDHPRKSAAKGFALTRSPPCLRASVVGVEPTSACGLLSSVPAPSSLSDILSNCVASTQSCRILSDRAHALQMIGCLSQIQSLRPAIVLASLPFLPGNPETAPAQTQ